MFSHGHGAMGSTCSFASSRVLGSGEAQRVGVDPQSRAVGREDVFFAFLGSCLRIFVFLHEKKKQGIGITR